ncbi:hypothetical protein G6009_01780 [Dietzia sp. SLG510A3-30A2]|nr:hypothetical protein [Dietzia sp. SLG510A3-30A2]
MEEATKGFVGNVEVSSTATGATLRFTVSLKNADDDNETHHPYDLRFTAEERDQLIAILQRSESE